MKFDDLATKYSTFYDFSMTGHELTPMTHSLLCNGLQPERDSLCLVLKISVVAALARVG